MIIDNNNSSSGMGDVECIECTINSNSADYLFLIGQN